MKRDLFFSIYKLSKEIIDLQRAEESEKKEEETNQSNSTAKHLSELRTLSLVMSLISQSKLCLKGGLFRECRQTVCAFLFQ